MTTDREQQEAKSNLVHSVSSEVQGPKSEAMKPCPFCGIALAVNDNQRDFYVRRYGTHYQHPVSDCFFSDCEVTPSEVKAWNRRALGEQQ